MTSWLSMSGDRFQSAPLTEARGDCPVFSLPVALPPVSIRSPHRSKGRPISGPSSWDGSHRFNPLPSPKQGETSTWLPSRRSSAEFQSAPLTEARGDRSMMTASCSNHKFQSAPLTEARGDRQHRASGLRAFGVSIRSPHRSKGRRNPISKMDEPAWFQSAPLTEARGDGAQLATGRKPDGFNPLPSPKQGETPRSAASRTHGAGFNPLPSPKQGETYGRDTHGLALALFQSAPLTEARGDFYSEPAAPSLRSFNPLPSPKQGETLHTARQYG